MSAQPSDSTPTTSERWNERTYALSCARRYLTVYSAARRRIRARMASPFSVSSFESSYTFCAFTRTPGIARIRSQGDRRLSRHATPFVHDLAQPCRRQIDIIGNPIDGEAHLPDLLTKQRTRMRCSPICGD